MPLYEYRCRSCERVFEVLQKFGDRPLRKCRHCSGRVDKLISRTSFQLKGSGWYADGYGRPSSGSGGASDAPGGKSKKPAKPAKKDKAKGSSD